MSNISLLLLVRQVLNLELRTAFPYVFSSTVVIVALALERCSLAEAHRLADDHQHSTRRAFVRCWSTRKTPHNRAHHLIDLSSRQICNHIFDDLAPPAHPFHQCSNNMSTMESIANCKRAFFSSSPAAKRAKRATENAPKQIHHGFVTVSAQSQRDARRTNDSLHKTIHLDPVTCVLLDTPFLQRLRGLSQLGTAFLGEFNDVVVRPFILHCVLSFLSHSHSLHSFSLQQLHSLTLRALAWRRRTGRETLQAPSGDSTRARMHSQRRALCQTGRLVARHWTRTLFSCV